MKTRTVEGKLLATRNKNKSKRTPVEMASDDETAVCIRLRAARMERNLTLESLAALSGFTKGYLSKIENAKKAPPIGSLARIARALNIDLSYFFTDPDREGAASTSTDDGPISVVHQWERKPVIRGGSAYGYDYVSLAHKKSVRQMDPFLFTFPAEINLDFFFEHAGEEFVFLLSGRVEFEFKLEGKLQRCVLEAGDSLYFDSSTPHRGRSLEGDAQAIVMIMESRESDMPSQAK